MTYTDRRAAGEILAGRLVAYAGRAVVAGGPLSAGGPPLSGPPSAVAPVSGSPSVAGPLVSGPASDAGPLLSGPPSAAAPLVSGPPSVAGPLVSGPASDAGPPWGGDPPSAEGAAGPGPAARGSQAARGAPASPGIAAAPGGAAAIDHPDHPAVVLGLVRGGVPVAAAIATFLRLPLDALVVRKLGVPWAPEVAFGALGPAGVQVLNRQVTSRLSAAEIESVIRQESAELVRREQTFRAGRPPLDLTGRVALIVDDGLATGATARAAVEVGRRLGAARVVLAVPVGSAQSVEHLSTVADEVICPWVPRHFDAVSRFYKSFPQLSDAEVVALLSDRHIDEP